MTQIFYESSQLSSAFLLPLAGYSCNTSFEEKYKHDSLDMQLNHSRDKISSNIALGRNQFHYCHILYVVSICIRINSLLLL